MVDIRDFLDCLNKSLHILPQRLFFFLDYSKYVGGCFEISVIDQELMEKPLRQILKLALVPVAVG